MTSPRSDCLNIESLVSRRGFLESLTAGGADRAKMEDVWSVENGILVCRGEPGGYLATQGEYESFQLVVEWRWPEEPGNSGVLMRIAGEPAMLPSSVEAQLKSGKLVNEATDREVRPGRIGLQSEGGVIHFRTITLKPMATG